MVGSPAYVAPEVLVGQYSEKVDIWSVGVLLHALLVGVLPFQGDSVEAIFEAIKKVKLDFKSGVWESVSQPAQNLIAHMLTRDVSARLTADEILSKLQIFSELVFACSVFFFGNFEVLKCTKKKISIFSCRIRKLNNLTCLLYEAF